MCARWGAFALLLISRLEVALMMAKFCFQGGSVAEQVGTAIEEYRRRLDFLPAAVIVNPTVEDEATVAMAELGLRVPVEGCGGCSADEMWLRV